MSPSMSWSGAFLPGPYDDSGHIGRSSVKSILMASPVTLYLRGVSDGPGGHDIILLTDWHLGSECLNVG